MANALLLLTLAVGCARGLRSQPPFPRAGVVVVTQVHAEVLDRLGPVWYYHYGFEGPSLVGHERVLLVHPHYDEVRLAKVLAEHPGSWWLVGNEPNDPHQDNLSPGAYALFYHRFFTDARRMDPSCRLATAGIANADWGWAQAFRERYRSEYGQYPAVDAWNIHNYLLDPAGDPYDVGTFRRRILDFRRWMAEVGEGDKPLFLTEFGVLYQAGATGRDAEDAERVITFMRDTVSWLSETDHVQCWAWFANYTGGQFNGDLYDIEGQLTPLGIAYRDAIAAELARK